MWGNYTFFPLRFGEMTLHSKLEEKKYFPFDIRLTKFC